MTTRQKISIGSFANDKNADGLRSGAGKINSNFVKVWQMLGGDSDILSTQISLTNTGIVWEGLTSDSFETTLDVTDPTASRTVTLPDASGMVVLRDTVDDLSNKTLVSPDVKTPRILSADSDFAFELDPATIAADRTVSIPALTDDDTLVFEDHTQTLTNKTLTSPVISSPRVETAIEDENGAEILGLSPAASAVNYLTVKNSATGNKTSLEASGTDSNVDVGITAKGTGLVQVSKLGLTKASMTANGAIPATTSLVAFNKATALAATLADGTVDGTVKTLVNQGAGTVTVTPTSFANGTSLALAQNEGCILVWVGSKWYVVGNLSTLTVA